MQRRASRLCIWALAAVFMVAVLAPSGARVFAAEKREEWQQTDRVVADLGLKNGARVADIGAGQGFFTFRLAKAVGDSGKVFATDIDAKALKTIADRVEREHLANVQTVQSEPTDTKLPAESVDVAFVSDVLHHVPPAQQAPLVKNTAQAIRPGGFLFVIDWRKSREVPFDPYDKMLVREDLVKLATDAGLSLDAEFHYLKYQVFLRFRKPPKATLAIP